MVVQVARLSSVKAITASDIEEGMAMQMWNYVLYCLPIFKAVTYV